MIMQSLLLISTIDVEKTIISDWLQHFSSHFSPTHTFFINETTETISIDTIRELNTITQFTLQPNEYRYIVILAAHLMTIAAQNALLKTLEEPPPQTYIILSTSKPNQLLPTIHSRCKTFFIDTEFKDDTTTAKQVFETLATTTHGELISFVNNYSTKEDALLLCNSMLLYMHQNIKNTTLHNKNDDKNIFLYSNMSKYSRIILQTIDQLQKNVNAKLALEHCLFELKRLQ